MHRRTRILVFSILLALLGTGSAYAIDNETTTVGGTCATGQNRADWDTMMECVSSAWARGPLFIGTTTDTCDANHAGMVSYDATQNLMRYCNGTTWGYL